MKNILLILTFTLLSITMVSAQAGIGVTFNTDIYQRYNNPEDGLAGTSSGSFLLNIGVGPKLWLGGNDVSLSVEASANLGLLGLDLNDYKGLGMVAFPLIARLNFGGLSGLDKEGKFGWTVGGGLQYSKTELYYLNNGDEELGVTRGLFKTIVAEIGYGFGMSGFGIYPYLRYGWNPDNSANSFNFGIRYDFNIPKLKQISDPESEL